MSKGGGSVRLIPLNNYRTHVMLLHDVLSCSILKNDCVSFYDYTSIFEHVVITKLLKHILSHASIGTNVTRDELIHGTSGLFLQFLIVLRHSTLNSRKHWWVSVNKEPCGTPTP